MHAYTHTRTQMTYILENISKILISFHYSLAKKLISPNHTSKECISETVQFLIRTCKQRPKSHNHIHMMKVCKNAVWILENIAISYFLGITVVFLITYINFSHHVILLIYLCTIYIYVQWLRDMNLIIQVVALLHDVADHKYVEMDETLLPKLDLFLDKITNTRKYKKIFMYSPLGHLFDTIQLKNIMTRISFSRQKKYGTYDWVLVLGYIGLFVRNVVSDADKFEAIGKDGIDRCIEYTREVYNRTNTNLSREQLFDEVHKHYDEKLKILASPIYIKTLPGLIYAHYLDLEMFEYIQRLQ